LAEIASQNFHEELILLKGARPFLFEKIAQRLEQKSHKTTLEINLAALAHNLQIYSNLLKKGVKMCAMVKASGYGSGAVEVARLLEFRGVDYLAVAYPDEGVELREAGIRLPILVLNAEPSSFEMLLRFELEPEIFSLEMLEKAALFAQNLPEGDVFSIHLKLDTGMHRLGFEEKDVADLVKMLKKNPSLDVRSIFSHLAASDTPMHDNFTKMQVENFQKQANLICKSLKINPLRHILNTGGIARWPDFQFDMVRLGIGLYGIGSTDLLEKLRVVNTLKATISQIKDVPTGESVGYNRQGRAEKPMRIATISLGYADGLPRAAGNGRFSVKIHGQNAPIIGNICMDMTMVDVTEIALARAGDEVIVFGETQPVEQLATVLNTIPYEIFTGISARVKRVYFLE
jgi:Alr-MurF fusion protein